MSNAGEDIPIAATPYLNGERLATGSLPPRHQLVVRERVVAGVVIVPTTHEDAGSRYRCMVEGEEGEVVAITRQTRIIVGGTCVCPDYIHVCTCTSHRQEM